MPETPTLLRCAVCGTGFKPNRGAKTCGDAECKRTHKRAVRHEWELRNPEYKTDYNRSYHAANGEKLRADMRAYYAANQDAQRARRRAYYAANRKAIIARQYEHTNRRRALRQSAPGDGISLEDWDIILELCDFCCAYCSVGLTEETGSEIEHVIPLSRGGWDDPSNAVPACRTCNASKNDKTPGEWRPDWTPPSWIILREASK